LHTPTNIQQKKKAQVVDGKSGQKITLHLMLFSPRVLAPTQASDMKINWYNYFVTSFTVVEKIVDYLLVQIGRWKNSKYQEKNTRKYHVGPVPNL